MDTWWFSYIILPLLIFFARITDVTLGTMRIILISKGKKNIAPLLGFFEILIWIAAISKIFQNLTNPVCYIAYAAGFAFGNYVGIRVEEKLALGTQLIRIITWKDARLLIDRLKGRGYGVTTIQAEGTRGAVHIIYTVTDRKNIPELTDLIHRYNPNAFYSVEDIRYVEKGVFPQPVTSIAHPRLFRRGRKGK